MKKKIKFIILIICISTLTIYNISFAKGIFQGEVTEGAPAQYSLVDFIDMDYYRNLAQSNGLYFTASADIDFNLFNLCREDDGMPDGTAGNGIQDYGETDESDGTTGVFDTGPPTFSGNPLPTDFNGIIFSEQDLRVQGTLCERSLTLVANDNIVVMDSIYTCPNQGCDCEYINLLLICENTFLISKWAPKVLHIQASIVSRTSNWRPEDYTDYYDSDNSHDDGRGDSNPFSMDLDRDGLIGGFNYGGNPQDGGNYNSDSWNEVNVLDQPNGYDVWDLEIVGAIITQSGGSASPWTTFASSSYGGKQTRHYNFDSDVLFCKPPESPHAGKWRKISWNEEIIQ